LGFPVREEVAVVAGDRRGGFYGQGGELGLGDGEWGDPGLFCLGLGVRYEMKGPSKIPGNSRERTYGRGVDGDGRGEE
jgi:hypothetical protein